MASAKVILYKHKTYKNGKHPLIVQLIINGKIKRISINRSLFPNEWDESLGLPTEEAIHRKEVTEKVIDVRAKIAKILTTLERDKPNFQFDDFVNLFSDKRTSISLTEYMNSLINRLKETNRLGNAYSYENALKALQKYAKKKEILFTDIDITFLNKWKEKHIKNGNSVNGHNVYLRAIRASYNKAIEENVLSANIYPFRKYKIVNEKVRKRAISGEDVKKINDMEFPEGSTLWHTQKLFMFSFFTIGMPWVDMANLKLKNIVGNRINYKRKKTGKEYSIETNSNIRQILNYYSNNKKKNDYVFPIIKRVSEANKISDTKNGLKNFNKHLEKIGEMAEINEKLTSYVARHSWASIANFKGVHIGIISEGLGHNDIKTTQTYLANFDHSDIDEANANIL